MALEFLRKTAQAFTPEASAFPNPTHQDIHRVRESVAVAFLRGDGLEIGALHQPLRVPSSARVRYVDRMKAADLYRQYEDLAEVTLVETDIIDNGETLATVADTTQDFVIANHFIEHCENPILTFQNLFRVLKIGGVLFMAVPDKRFTFDADRPCTSIDHLVRDYAEGPAWSKRQHFEEWSRLVNKRTTEAQVDEEVRHLLNIGYSIHYHVWDARELMRFMVALRDYIRCELELFLRNGMETILVLRKAALQP